MASQILVPLRGSDQIEQLLPYIERVVQPGLHVISLSTTATLRSMN